MITILTYNSLGFNIDTLFILLSHYFALKGSLCCFEAIKQYCSFTMIRYTIIFFTPASVISYMQMQIHLNSRGFFSGKANNQPAAAECRHAVVVDSSKGVDCHLYSGRGCRLIIRIL